MTHMIDYTLSMSTKVDKKTPAVARVLSQS